MLLYDSLVNCVFGDVHPDDDKWGRLLEPSSSAEISYYSWKYPSVKVRGAWGEEDDGEDVSAFQSLQSFVENGYTYLVYHDLDRKDHFFLICLEEEEKKKAFAWFYAVPFSIPGGPVAGLDGFKTLAWRAMPRPLPTNARLLDAFVGPRMEVFVGKEAGGARALRSCIWEKLPPRITNATPTRPMDLFIGKGEAAPVFKLPPMGDKMKELRKEPKVDMSTTVDPDGYRSEWDGVMDCDEEGEQMDGLAKEPTDGAFEVVMATNTSFDTEPPLLTWEEVFDEDGNPLG